MAIRNPRFIKSSLLYVGAIFWNLDEKKKKSLEMLMYCDIGGFLNSKLHNTVLLRTIRQSKDAPGTTN